MSLSSNTLDEQPDTSRQLTASDYARAERFLPPNSQNLVSGLNVSPNWIADGNAFWYVRTSTAGKEFVLIDIAAAKRSHAFDHPRLAAALTHVTSTPCEPWALPFDSIDINQNGSGVSFQFNDVRWTCDLSTYHLTSEKIDPDTAGSPSPNGRWTIQSAEFNLTLVDRDSDRSEQLTTDGTEERPYGLPLESPLEEAGIDEPDRWSRDVGLWSPDSRYVLSYRIDRSQAETYHWLQNSPLDGSARPKLYTRPYPLPGEETVPQATLILVDTETHKVHELGVDPISILYYGGPLRKDRIWWSEGVDHLYVLHQARGFQTYTLWRIDCVSGDAEQLITEHDEYAATDLHPSLMGSPQIALLERQDRLLWFSQRDGWGHLYTYSISTGELQQQITSGPWSVLEVLHIDGENDWLYFSAIGVDPSHDPYFPHLYRLRTDGSEMSRLTDVDAFHDLSAAPDGSAFLDTYSRVDLPPITVLRNHDGSVRLEIERADITELVDTGWSPPERFRTKARDGVTDVYGVMFLPTWFDRENPSMLPVLDDIYAGPQTNRAPATFASTSRLNPRQSAGFWHAQAIAELGFAVVMVDGLGMPFRSRRFHSHSFQNLMDGGIEEHVLAIRDLGRRYRFLDTERVGIYGHSAGGYSSMNAMLRFPDFYKVAVSSAGNHDHRLDKASWIERYMGLPVGLHYEEQANASRVENLKGKLLLIHGEMDENVHVSSTFQLVDALIKANKNFDMLILPNRPHACVDDPYFVRRRWDYFVEHLLGAKPPESYQIGQLLR